MITNNYYFLYEMYEGSLMCELKSWWEGVFYVTKEDLERN